MTDLTNYFCFNMTQASVTGKSVSEALILAWVNPQYDDRLFIDLQLLTQKNTNSEHVVYKNCFECQNKNKTNFCTQHVLNLYFSRSMNNLSSYCGLTDSRMSASDTDLPVHYAKK